MEKGVRADTKARGSQWTVSKQTKGTEVSGHGGVVGQFGLKYWIKAIWGRTGPNVPLSVIMPLARASKLLRIDTSESDILFNCTHVYDTPLTIHVHRKAKYPGLPTPLAQTPFIYPTSEAYQ